MGATNPAPCPFVIMRQADIDARREYDEIVNDIPTEVRIPGTKKVVKLRGVKPYTLERLTRLWLERDMDAVPEDAASTLKSLCSEPYFAVKEALLFVLNSYWKIRLFHRFLSWWWGKVIGYTEEQMSPIILEGKKKLPLTAHWTNMAFSTDMRTDMIKMTRKEAEQYRAEQLSVLSQLSSRNSLATEG